MTLDQATELIKSCAEQMNARYKRVVFDEWAIVWSTTIIPFLWRQL
jgi:hypothetical protein